MLETYLPSERSMGIRYHLQRACRDPLNSPMYVCVHLDEMLLKGVMFYRNSRTLYGNFMQIVHQYIGGRLEGLDGTIITEPQSEEYCIQYYSLWDRIPVNHPDARLDIKKILKLRVDEDTHACPEYHYLEAMRPSIHYPTPDERIEENTHELHFYWTATNISHPIYAIYNATASIIENQILSQDSINFIDAAKVATTRNFSVSTNSILISLATERNRLELAQRIYTSINNATYFKPLHALTITARMDENSLLNIADGFISGDNSEVDGIRSIYRTFDTFDPTDFRILKTLMDNAQLDTNNALRYLTYLDDFRIREEYLRNSEANLPDLNLELFITQVSILQNCGLYNSTHIVNFISHSIFGYILGEAMQPCREYAKQISHSGFLIHNLIPDYFHDQAHQLQDSISDDEDMMKIVMFMLLLSTLAIILGTLNYGARFCRKNKKSTASNDDSYEERTLIVKTQKTVKTTVITSFLWTQKKDNVLSKEKIASLRNKWGARNV